MKLLICCLLVALATGARADRVPPPGAASHAAFAARAPGTVATDAATSCVAVLATRLRYAAVISYRALKWKRLEPFARGGQSWTGVGTTLFRLTLLSTIVFACAAVLTVGVPGAAGAALYGAALAVAGVVASAALTAAGVLQGAALTAACVLHGALLIAACVLQGAALVVAGVVVGAAAYPHLVCIFTLSAALGYAAVGWRRALTSKAFQPFSRGPKFATGWAVPLFRLAVFFTIMSCAFAPPTAGAPASAQGAGGWSQQAVAAAGGAAMGIAYSSSGRIIKIPDRLNPDEGESYFRNGKAAHGTRRHISPAGLFLAHVLRWLVPFHFKQEHEMYNWHIGKMSNANRAETFVRYFLHQLAQRGQPIYGSINLETLDWNGAWTIISSLCIASGAHTVTPAVAAELFMRHPNNGSMRAVMSKHLEHRLDMAGWPVDDATGQLLVGIVAPRVRSWPSGWIVGVNRRVPTEILRILRALAIAESLFLSPFDPPLRCLETVLAVNRGFPSHSTLTKLFVAMTFGPLGGVPEVPRPTDEGLVGVSVQHIAKAWTVELFEGVRRYKNLDMGGLRPVTMDDVDALLQQEVVDNLVDRFSWIAPDTAFTREKWAQLGITRADVVSYLNDVSKMVDLVDEAHARAGRVDPGIAGPGQGVVM